MDVKRWFKHDVSATEDVKLKTLCIRHPNGLGYAVFFAALELMAKHDDCAIDTDECTMITIADTLKISDYEKVVAVIADCEKYGLFKVDGERIYSERLRSNMEEIQTSAAKRAAAGKKAAAARWKNANEMQTDCKRNANEPENDAITMQTQCERITNACKNDANAMQTQCDLMRLDAIGCQDKDKEKEKEIINRSINTSLSFSGENDPEFVEVEEVEDFRPNNREKNNYTAIVQMYNEICKSFPAVTKISEKRKKAISARLKSYTIEEIRRCFELAEASDFLKGANNRNWKGDFDWLMCDSNLAKVLDGKYQNKNDNGRNYENIRFAPPPGPGAAGQGGTRTQTTDTGTNYDWVNDLPPIGC